MRLGIDLGGTKIEIIALDSEGKVLHIERIPTPQHDYQGTLQALKRLVEKVEHLLEETGSVGICSPGATSPASGLLRNSNSVCLNNRPFLQDLEQLLQREVAIANDANCFAISEATDGAAQGASSVFGVIIGTGTGAGIVIDGKVLNGVNAVAGEWGHNPLPWANPDELPGNRCYCGKQGCIETWLSGVGFARHFEQQTGRALTAPEILEASAQGDEACESALRRYEDRMARSLSHVINILDPEVIVLGGGMSNMQRLYQNVPRLWQRYVFSDHVATRLVAPKHGDSSGVRGAAWLGELT